jgi:hypothetical protein
MAQAYARERNVRPQGLLETATRKVPLSAATSGVQGH